MTEHWLIRGRDAVLKTESLAYDEHFFVDGRWSRSTILDKLVELREQAEEKHGIPIEFFGYERLGARDSGLHPMPYIGAFGAHRKIDGHSVRWFTEGSGHHRVSRWEVSREVEGRMEFARLDFKPSKNGCQYATITTHAGSIHSGNGLSRLQATKSALSLWQASPSEYRMR